MLLVLVREVRRLGLRQAWRDFLEGWETEKEAERRRRLARVIHLACVGACGRIFAHDEEAGSRFVEVICEPCWLRLYGEPAVGFTGFGPDGSHWTVEKYAA